jgi:hypothetical protein
MRGATVLRESCAATGELSHARRVATHVPRAGEVAARQKFFARAELALDGTVLQLTIVRRPKPPRPAMAGAACPARAGRGAHTVAGRGGFFRWSRDERDRDKSGTGKRRFTLEGGTAVANEVDLNLKPLKAKSAEDKQKFLKGGVVRHIDVTKNAGIVPVVEAMQHMAFSSRDLHRAADIMTAC